MRWFSALLSKQAGEGGALLKNEQSSLHQTGDENFRWAQDALDDRKKAAQRIYDVFIPWDVLAILVLLGPCIAVVGLGPTYFLWLFGFIRERSSITFLFYLQHVLPGILCALFVFSQTPKKVVRETDALVLEFPFHQSIVPLGNILELVVLDRGFCPFLGLLQKWRIFPCGLTLRCFCGAPTSQGVVCVLLTTHCFWSFVFCLRDPVQFLVDNQKPLDLTARYRTTNRILLRDGWSLKSKKLGTIKQGHYFRIEEQRGQRVLVQFEGNNVRGWMSYISQVGRFLLDKGQDANVLAPGTIGSSELSRSYGAAIEMPTLSIGDEVVE